MARSSCSVVYMVMLLAVMAAGRASGGDPEVACRVSDRAVQKFADLVFPMELTGSQKMAALPLGGALGGEIRWTANVSHPVVRITARERTFEATVKANAGGITWNGVAKGKLDISYESKSQQLIVRVRDAIVPLSMGPVSVPIDVSKQVPVFRFSVALPEVIIPEKRRVVRVSADPEIRFEDGAVLVTSDVAFELKAPR